MSGNIMYVNQATLDRCSQKIADAEKELSDLLKLKGEAASHHMRGADWQETPIPEQIAMQESLARTKLEELKKVRATMKVVKTVPNDVIHIGSTVTILLQEEDEEEPEEFELLLVATAPKAHKADGPVEVSKNTELGRAILGKKAHDIIRYKGNDDNILVAKILTVS